MRMPDDKAANQPVFDIDPEFGKMAVAMGQVTWGIETLSQREKSLFCLMYDICIRGLALPFQMHVEMALANDVPLADLHEAILFSAADAGHSTALGALVRFKEICSALKHDFPQSAEDQEAPSIDYFEGLSPLSLETDLAARWGPPMARFWRTGGSLSLKERACLSLVANIAQQVLGAPFTHHAQLALAHGATAAELTALITFTSEFGFSKAWTASAALAEVLNTEVH
jgi:4-carboxymuconolactone decarboxylase